MKTVNILHLSDLHIGDDFFMSDKTSRSLHNCTAKEYLARKLVSDYHENFLAAPSCIVISGDLTNTGSSSEFLSAREFIDILFRELQQKYSKKSPTINNLVIVPGNHDISFEDCKKHASSNYGEPWKTQEKLQNYRDFYGELYGNSRVASKYDISSGYSVFPIPESNLLIVGFDSCRRISHHKTDRQGYIFQDQINSAGNDLRAITRTIKDGEKALIKVGVCHHNPYILIEFLKSMQEDSLVSKDQNMISLTKNGFKLLMHGHAHTSYFNLFKGHDGKCYVCGVGAVGKFPKTGYGHQYSVITIDENGSLQQLVRFLDIGPGMCDGIGKGKWTKLSKISRRGFLNIDERNKFGRSKLNKKAIEAPKSIGRTEFIENMERYYSFRIIGSRDHAIAILDYLDSVCKDIADKLFLKCLKLELEIDELTEKNPPNEIVKGKYIQLNNLINESELEVTAKSLLPDWMLRCERHKYEIIVARLLSSRIIDAINDMKEGIVSLINVLEETPKEDFITPSRVIRSLIMINEYSLARRYLRKYILMRPRAVVYQIMLADLYMSEHNYSDAVRSLMIAKSIIGVEIEVAEIDFLISLCYYYSGELNSALIILEKWATREPDHKIFKNNYTFAKFRELLREQRNEVYSNPYRALVLLEGFVNAIAEIGWNATSHFNYALMLYYAQTEGHFDEALKIVKKGGIRSDLKTVAGAFKRAQSALEKEHDYKRCLFADYYEARVSNRLPDTIRKRLLDAFCWDADNFVTSRIQLDYERYSLLFKDRTLKDPNSFDHLSVLKRWGRDIHPLPGGGINTGGGYFLRHNGFGIAINPGSGFLTSFKACGYSASEIDAIVVTSARLADYEELPLLLSIIEQSSNYGIVKRENVKLVLERQVFTKFSYLLTKENKGVCDPQMITLDGISLFDDRVIIKCAKGSTRIVNFEYVINGRREVATFVHEIERLGKMELEDVLKLSSIVIVSVGRITFNDLLEEETRECLKSRINQIASDHPIHMLSLGIGEVRDMNSEYYDTKDGIGVESMIRIVESSPRRSVIVLSDIGFELGDKRHILARVMSEMVEGKCCITGDLGLTVGLDGQCIYCEYNGMLINRESMDEECLEGNYRGIVRHFEKSVRMEPDFREFLEVTI